ncbi:MAG: hypothetical protein KGM98_07575 [Bacteroidota bacterium]|nr:hypothetical protein [Bacteroidota bacterium]
MTNITALIMKKATGRVDHSKMKLGRLPAKNDPRTLHITGYLADHPDHFLPEKWYWGEKVPPNRWGIMYNQRIEDCTCAAAGHFVMTWSSSTGRLVRPKNEVILETYRALTGYDPKTRKNDTGATVIDLLKYWRKYYIDGHKIMAFARVDPKNHKQVRQTVYLFGGCYVGLNLPESAKKQAVWKVPPKGITGRGKPGSWSGHCVLIIGYDPKGLQAVTWGKVKTMTWEFLETYCEEAYAVFSEDFVKNHHTPIGVNVEQLKTDVEKLRRENR